MCSYALATANLAFSLLLLPFCLRVNLRCKHLNRAEDFSRYFGFSKTEPFDKVANVFIPTSIPTAVSGFIGDLPGSLMPLSTRILI